MLAEQDVYYESAAVFGPGCKPHRDFGGLQFLQPFNPLYFSSVWKESGATNNRISLVIHLPNEVEPKMFTFHVVEGGGEIELKIDRRLPLIDPALLHRE